MSIYVPDIAEFKRLRDVIRDLWFNRFGVYLSKGEILLTCIQFTKDNLAGKGSPPLNEDSNSRIMFKYARVSE